MTSKELFAALENVPPEKEVRVRLHDTGRVWNDEILSVREESDYVVVDTTE